MLKKILVPALVLAAASAALPASAAQSWSAPRHGPTHSTPAYQNSAHHGPAYNGWQSINQRQANLDRRIDVGLRNGSLSRREATRLRSEFNGLSRLEASYRRGGLSGWERADLDRRFDRLSAQIRNERNDRDDRRGDHRRHG